MVVIEDRETEKDTERERERLEVEVDNGIRVPRESCLPFRHCQGLRIQRIDVPQDSSVSFQFYHLSALDKFDRVRRCLGKEKEEEKREKM